MPAGVGSAAPSGEDESTVSLVPVRAAEGHAFEAVCAGYDHTCGLDASGRAHCWGEQRLVGSAGHNTASRPALERRRRRRQRSCRCSNNASVPMQDAFPRAAKSSPLPPLQATTALGSWVPAWMPKRLRLLWKWRATAPLHRSAVGCTTPAAWMTRTALGAGG